MSDPTGQRYRRWLAWYHDGCPDDCQPDPSLAAEWPDLDEGESKSNYIARNDVPEMLDEIGQLRAALKNRTTGAAEAQQTPEGAEKSQELTTTDDR